MIDDLLSTLGRSGIQPAPDELLDALWLAQHIVPRDLATASVPSEDQTTARPRQRSDSATTKSLLSSVADRRATDLYAVGDDPDVTLKGLVTRSPAVPALRHQRDLARALRPFRRRTLSRSSFLMDEEATASRIADEGIRAPVLRPALERWPTLTLVVDTAPSMVVWQRTVEELRALFEWLGAFRRIRLRTIDTDSAGSLRLSSTMDTGERDVILLVTDALGSAWHDGRVHVALRQLASRASTAVLSVLPQRMWSGSGLRPAPGHLPPTTVPGVPRNQAIPILELSARWLTPWAEHVIGGKAMRAALLGDPPLQLGLKPAFSAGPDSAQRIERFRAAASPLAFRLACYLSATWLNLPVMRLVQYVMLPNSDTSHLAEVFLGGLLRQVTPPNGPPRPEAVQYEFLPGVRTILNSHLTRDDLLVIMRQTSSYVSNQLGLSSGFPALLADPEGHDVSALTGEHGQPLAQVTTSMLAQLGGRYKALGDRLSRAPTRRRHYTSDRMWVEVIDGRRLRLGVTDQVLDELQEITKITLPDVGGQETEVLLEGLTGSETLATDLQGEIIAVNHEVMEDPELLLDDPHDRGWLFEMTLTDLKELDSLSTQPPDRDPPVAGILNNSLEDHVSKAVMGDRRAVDALLAAIMPIVMKYCRARVGHGQRSSASAEDVAQEICVSVLKALPNYKEQGRPFLMFVYGIAAHKVADAHRASARNRAESVPELPDSADARPAPEERALEGELSERMGRLLTVLPDRQREILLLRVVVGLSVEETAEAVGSTPRAVRLIAHRALARLRSTLNKQEVQTLRQAADLR